MLTLGGCTPAQRITLNYGFHKRSAVLGAKDDYDPIMMEEVKCRPAGFTKWDKTTVNKGTGQDLTLEQFRAAQKSSSLQSSSMFGGRGEFSAYAMDSISMRQERTSSEADGRSQVSTASSGGAAGCWR